MPDNIGMTETTRMTMIGELRKALKRLHYPLEVMLVCARWDAAYPLSLRQCKDLNNIVEQDRRAVKRVTTPMLGFKSFWSAKRLIAGIETMHMIKKGQLHGPGGQVMSAADQFYR